MQLLLDYTLVEGRILKEILHSDFFLSHNKQNILLVGVSKEGKVMKHTLGILLKAGSIYSTPKPRHREWMKSNVLVMIN